jgi:transposase
LERFPAYAPELNPDEGIWKLAKQKLANGRPRDRCDLMLSLLDALETIRTSRKNLRGCITHSELPPFLP